MAKNKKYQRGTGGGPPQQVVVDQIDEKVMELMSPVCVTGNLEVPEPSLTIEQQIFSSTKQMDVEESSEQNAKVLYICNINDKQLKSQLTEGWLVNFL